MLQSASFSLDLARRDSHWGLSPIAVHISTYAVANGTFRLYFFERETGAAPITLLLIGISKASVGSEMSECEVVRVGDGLIPVAATAGAAQVPS